LWPTLPKANVTVPPTLSAIVGGVKASDGVASTCAAETGGGLPAPVVDGVSGFVDELQPATIYSRTVFGNESGGTRVL